MSKKKKSYWTTLLKICRQHWSRNYPDRKECLSRAESPKNDLKKWDCSICKQSFAMSEIQVDHVLPVDNTIPQDIEEFWESFRRLHVKPERLQVLCKSCHVKKTKEETSKKSIRKMIGLIENQLKTVCLFSRDYRLNDLDKKDLRTLCTLLSQHKKENDLKRGSKMLSKITNILNGCKRREKNGQAE